MTIRKVTLISNIVLLVIIFASLFRGISADVLFLGIGLGALVSLPSLMALISPGRVSDSVLLGLNVAIMLLLATVTIASLYNRLLVDNGEPVVGLMVILFLCLALCASLQLLILSTKKMTLADNVDSCLHKVYGGPSIMLMLAIGMILTGVVQSLVFALGDFGLFFQALESKLLHRGVIPYLCLILFFWGLLLLVGNYMQLRYERQSITKDLTSKPEVAASATCTALTMLYKESRANSKAKKIVCIDQLLDMVWQKSEHVYAMPRYINWAVPILGFIGTVLGISLAAESIGGLISSPDTNFSSALGDAIAPLGIAFDTTLVALTLSVVFMLMQTLSQRWQERQVEQLEQSLRNDV